MTSLPDPDVQAGAGQAVACLALGQRVMEAQARNQANRFKNDCLQACHGSGPTKLRMERIC